MGGSVKNPSPERLPRSRGYLRTLRREQGGQALVEFGLVAPILLLLVLGILDFGRALNYYNQQSQLVGQGARAAAVNCNPDGTCGSAVTSNSIQTQLAEKYATGELNKKTSVCISLPNGAKVGQPVKLTASYQFKFLPLIGDVLGSPTITISASQTERQETVGNYSPVCAS
jgi:Flp pilus assembly protein TadG